jgi:anti-sigma factor RsiW
MDHEKQLKLQAFLDEELSEADANEVASWLAKDQEATLLLAELRNTRQSMARFETGIRLPESREFYWSKIKREIERLEPAAARPEPVRTSWLAAWRKFLIPAGAMAALLIAFLVTIGPPTPPAGGVEAESAYNDPGTFVYHDYDNHATLVWLSYPAEKDFPEAEPSGKVQ